MGKRRTTDSPSDEEQESSKRAKLQRPTNGDEMDEEDEGEDVPVASTSRAGKSKKKVKAEANEHDDDDDVVAEGADDDEDARLEAQQGEIIRAAIENKGRTYGGIADHGIIENLEMHQFMCHKYLTFNFGPQINFIIGHNGSGKSAVLTALTIALGGKASSTGRGSGLKSFIREGQSVSEVSVTIKNRGEEAFKPKEYGSSIIITRRFTKDGSSTWKIKSKDGRVVSTKREELAAICDHMNIQVDNPMNVLTQDSARQFLSASTPSDKYKLFLRGTQLAQLSQEYDTCLENISTTAKMLAKKREVIPDLRANLKEVSDRFEEASKAREQRKKVDELKKELAWAHVAAKEREMEDKFVALAKAEERIPRAKEKLQEAQNKIRAAEREIEERESEFTQLGEPDDLKRERDRVGAELNRKGADLRDVQHDIREMNSTFSRLDNQIKEFENTIQQENAKMEARADGKLEELQRQLKAAQEEFTIAEDAAKALLARVAEQREVIQRIDGEGRQAQRDRQTKQERLLEIQAAKERAGAARNNEMAVYGQKMPEALRRIAAARWQGEAPIGPFGRYVKLRDHKWAPVIRGQLGQLMFAFTITDSRDRAQLKDILDKAGCQAQIIVASRELFDFSRGQPPEEFLTFLRVLEIQDEVVLRVLVNVGRIEKTLLFDTRAEAADKLHQMPGGGVAFTLDNYQVRNYGDGGEQSTPTNNSNARFANLFPKGNPEEQIRHFEQQYQELEAEIKDINSTINRHRSLHQEAQAKLRQLQEEEKAAGREVTKAKLKRDRLQDEANAEVPVGIAPIMAARNETIQEREALTRQFTEVEERKTRLEQEMVPLKEELRRLRRQIEEFDGRRTAVQSLIEEAVAKHLQAQNDVNHFKEKLQAEEKRVEKVRESAEDCQLEFQDWTEKAEKYCARVETTRKPDEISRQLESTQKALNDQQKRHGATVEEMTLEVNKAQAALQSAERDLRIMGQLNKTLRQSVLIRLSKWEEFRRHIALRTKLIFQYHLANRGYYGKILFDHHNLTLNLKVQTDDQAGTQNKEKDPKSLSGGEKSFSTICLLLALWEAIGCPIRCLDEFDVYMDAVNRRISMKMMIETANASDKKQYILITPQDMNNINIGKTVRVHRMTDPERGQGRLAFGA